MSEPDPIDTDDPAVLRAEILRLRDHGVGRCPREVLESLAATRDTQITEYDAEVSRLRDVVRSISPASAGIDRRRS